MIRRRTAYRSMTALFAVFSLLFAQLTLTNYACPAQADAAVMAEMAADSPCDQMDADKPVLCHQHRADAAQSPEASKVPTPSLPAVVRIIVHTVLIETTSASLNIRLASAEAQPPQDPLFLSTLRLRV